MQHFFFYTQVSFPARTPKSVKIKRMWHACRHSVSPCKQFENSSLADIGVKTIAL